MIYAYIRHWFFGIAGDVWEFRGKENDIENLWMMWWKIYQTWVSSQAIDVAPNNLQNFIKINTKSPKITDSMNGYFSWYLYQAAHLASFLGSRKEGYNLRGGIVCSTRWGNPTRIPSVNPAEELVPRYKYANIDQYSYICCTACVLCTFQGSAGVAAAVAICRGITIMT